MDPLFVGSGGVGHGPRPTPAMSSESSGSEFFFFFFFFFFIMMFVDFSLLTLTKGMSSTFYLCTHCALCCDGIVLASLLPLVPGSSL
jgi:hypothetical protein